MHFFRELILSAQVVGAFVAICMLVSWVSLVSVSCLGSWWIPLSPETWLSSLWLHLLAFSVAAALSPRRA